MDYLMSVCAKGCACSRCIARSQVDCRLLRNNPFIKEPKPIIVKDVTLWPRS